MERMTTPGPLPRNPLDPFWQSVARYFTARPPGRFFPGGYVV
jgi:hypothetical protein